MGVERLLSRKELTDLRQTAHAFANRLTATEG